MKKITLLLLLLGFTSLISAQCLTSVNGQWPTGTYTIPVCNGLTQNSITTCGYASEYSVVTVVTGETYTFGSSITTDIVTISTDSGATAETFGTGSVTWVSTVTGDVRFYTNLDDGACGAQSDCRVKYVVCGIPPTCIAPTAVLASNITTTSATVSWTASVSVPAIGYELYYSTSSTAPLNSDPAFSGEGPGVLTTDLSALTPSTNYYVWIRSVCSSSDTSDWSSVGSFATLCNAVTDFTESFDADVAFPVCWARVGTGGGANVQASTTTTSTPNNLYLYGSSATSQGVVAMIPVSNAGDGTHRLRFRARANFTVGGNIEVGYLTNPSDATSFVGVQTFTTTSTTVYDLFTANLGTAPGSNQVLAFRHSGVPAYSVLIDDVIWEPIPSCAEATGLSLTSLTVTSATIAWTAPASAPAAGYEYVYDITNTAPTDTTSPSGSTAAGVTTVSLSGLTPDTQYYFWVRSNCSSTSKSPWSVVLPFFTGICVPVATNASTYINDFSTTGGITNIANNASGFTTGGYQNNFDTATVTSFIGGTVDYSYSIVGGTTGVAIWVDWNNNLSFEITERVYTSNTYLADGTYTGSISVPNGTALGDYRMRIRTDWNATNPDPCAVSFNRTEAEDYKFTVTTAPADAMDFINIQWVTDGTNGSNTSLTVPANTVVTAYAQGYESGITEAAGVGAGVEAWIGHSSTNTDPATWPASAWTVATYVDNQGNNDNFSAGITMPVGTNYVASRWKLNAAAFTYGGYNGAWNGTTNNAIQVIVLPVVNDDCSGSIALTVNSDLGCTSVTPSTINGATASTTDATSCFGTEDDDVWFSFVATATTHQISLLNVTGSTTDLYHSLWTGADCANLTLVANTCSDANTSLPTGLVIGQTYYLRVYSWTATTGQTSVFDVCIGTLPPPPANDDCSTAVVLTPGATFNENPLTATNASATNSNPPAPGCASFSGGDVWYQVIVPASGSITLETNSDTTSQISDTGMAIYSGSCSALVLVECDDDDSLDGYFSLISLTGRTPGEVLYVNAWEYGNDTMGTFKISAYDASLANASFSSSNFTFYPNPVKDVLNISTAQNISKVQVINLLGQEMMVKTMNESQGQIDMSHLSTGTYLVKVTSEDQVRTIKVIKE